MRSEAKVKTGEAQTPAKILVVEDEPNMVAGLRDNFEFEGYTVITARDGQLNLDRALPSPTDTGPVAGAPESAGVLTARDMARLERENLRRALEATGWKIAGDAGAARMLGLAPSTLASRVKALRLRRHR